MRKILRLLLIGVMVFAGISVSNSVNAALTDTFTITVTVNYIEINLRNTADNADYTTWAIGSLAPSGTSAMTNTGGVRVMHGTSSQNTDIQSYVSIECAIWDIGPAIGADVYKLEVEGYDTVQNPPAMAGTTVLDAVALKTITTATDVSADKYLYYKFSAPSSTTTGAQQTITITVGVIVHV